MLIALSLRLAGGISTYARYRNTVSELSVLSDRQLADIGIVRLDIERIARGSSVREVRHPSPVPAPRQAYAA